MPRRRRALGALGLAAVGAALALGGHRGGTRPGAHAGAPARPGCALPPRDCLGRGCAALVQFAPAAGPGYEDVPLDDERTPATSTSYVRRDLMMAIQHATATVACVARTWPGGLGAPLALGDGSDRAGATPGTAQARPRHPPSTHVDGRDLDLAYYQLDQPDNHLRAICDHVVAGVDQRHCVGPPRHLDAARTALLIGVLLESPRVRTIGVDAAAAPALEAALRDHCRAGRVGAAACPPTRLSYEPVDRGRGWFYAHHNHLHVAWR